MKGNRWFIGFSVLVLLLVIYANAFGLYSFFIDIKSQVTGKLILDDKEFIIDAEKVGAGSKFLIDEETISLSPDENSSSECIFDSVHWDSSSALIGETVKLIVEGNGCRGKKVNLTIYEKDLFFDDGVKRFRVSFVNGVASVELDLDENITKLFN